MAAPLEKISLTIFQRFFRTETLGGVVLLAFGLGALIIANSPLAEAYNHLWEIPLMVKISDHQLSLTLHGWINDGLMAMFFLLVGLEIKRELLAGELSSARQAALPIACAIGGMVVPAGIYLIFNFGGIGSHGWGIPMATDIAFALGALNLIAPRAPIGAKVMLTALAIVDDMGAVLVIAFFYSEAIVWSALASAAVILLVLIGFNLIGVRHLWPYYWEERRCGCSCMTLAYMLRSQVLRLRSRFRRTRASTRWNFPVKRAHCWTTSTAQKRGTFWF